jgi:hypothetical protein
MPNALSSRTSSVANGVVSHPVPAKAQGVHLYLKYTKGDGTSVLIIPTFIDPELDPTDEYEPVYFDANMAPAVLKYVFAVSGNYRVPVPMALSEKKVNLAVAFTGGTTQVLVLDVRTE